LVESQRKRPAPVPFQGAHVARNQNCGLTGCPCCIGTGLLSIIRAT
jgi:hypothetical protein